MGHTSPRTGTGLTLINYWLTLMPKPLRHYWLEWFLIWLWGRKPDEDLSFSQTDSAAFIPKAVVIDHNFDWGDDKSPNIPYYNSVIYEAHVKGFTKLHPEIPENIRGTYADSAPSCYCLFKRSGYYGYWVNAVHDFLSDRHLVDEGLTNYWGYNTIGFFAPDARYASCSVLGEQVIEFKNMVKELHKAGIEVILDVVYNHTGEGSQMGQRYLSGVLICFLLSLNGWW